MIVQVRHLFLDFLFSSTDMMTPDRLLSGARLTLALASGIDTVGAL